MLRQQAWTARRVLDQLSDCQIIDHCYILLLQNSRRIISFLIGLKSRPEDGQTYLYSL